jgi:hypothetical protein
MRCMKRFPMLGLRQPDPRRMSQAIPFGMLLTGKVPKHDVVEDHYSAVSEAFQMYRNNEYGLCGPAAVANQRILLTTYLGDTQVIPTQDEVFDLYCRASKPSFDPVTGNNDNGVVMQELCDELVRGGIAGIKAVAFARVNMFNLEEAAASVSIFGSVLLGLQLTVAQQEQMAKGIWDYKWNCASWGGHAVLGCGYDKRNPKKATGNIITWDQNVKMTLAFMKHQVSECWVVIWPENLGTKQFQQGINLDSLKDAYNEITGRKLVLP